MSKKCTNPVTSVAEQALANYQFGRGVSVVGPPRWGAMGRRRLMGIVPCRFPNLSGTHDIHFRVTFDADGAVADVLAYEGVFATPIGQPGKLPGDRANLGPDENERADYADLDLWQHPETGLVWIPERMKGRFRWDKAQRMPGHMNDAKGHRGFHDWRIPTVDELQSLHAALVDPETSFPYNFFAQFVVDVHDGRAESADRTCIWSSDKRAGHKDQGVLFDFRSGNSSSRDTSDRFPILVVRDPYS